MLPSQIDFRAFRVSLSSWLVLGRGLLLQLTVQVGRAVSARFAPRSWPIGQSVPLQALENTLISHVLSRVLKHVHPFLLDTCDAQLHNKTGNV